MNNKTRSNRLVAVSLVLVMLMSSAFLLIGSNDKELSAETIESNSNFGGSSGDEFVAVASTSDGYVAVGYSSTTSFGNGDWTGVPGNGGEDAIIVKYDLSGNIVWKQNFGTAIHDRFNDVIAVSDGYVAVGYAYSFGAAIVVKYDFNGNVVWNKEFGGSASDVFTSVVLTTGGFIAAGHSERGSFGNGDWVGFSFSYDVAGIVVKYDFNGNVVWKKNPITENYSLFRGVTVAPDGSVICVGDMIFNNENPPYEGSENGVIVKLNSSGNRTWVKNFGSNSTDYFTGVIATSNRYIVTAYAPGTAGDFGDYDNPNIGSPGRSNSVILHFNSDSALIGGYGFGYSGTMLNDITLASDGYYVIGRSNQSDFGKGGLAGLVGKGSVDIVVAKFNLDGYTTPTWKKNFGGSGADYGLGIAATSDNFVGVGYAGLTSFGSADWMGLTGRGGNDAVLFSDIPIKEQMEITSIPIDSVVQNGLWIYTPQTNASDVTFAVSGASWLSVNGNTISGIAPALPEGTPIDYSVSITASKSGWVSDTQTFSLTVTPTFTVPPIAELNITHIDGKTFSIDASTSSNFSSISYDLGDGTILSGISSTQYTYVRSGIYHVSVTASSSGFAPSTITQTVVVFDDVAISQADIGSQYRYVIPVTLSGNVPTLTQAPLWLTIESYGHDDVSNRDYVIVTGNVPLTAVPGTIVPVTVTIGGSTESWTITLNAGSKYPVAGFTVSANGMTVTITPTFRNATVISYDLGNGTTRDTPSTFSYTYSAPGTYTITQTVIGYQDGAAFPPVTFQRNITVKETPITPPEEVPEEPEEPTNDGLGQMEIAMIIISAIGILGTIFVPGVFRLIFFVLATISIVVLAWMFGG